MILYDFRRYPRRSLMSRRVADRRIIPYSFGSEEWVENIKNHYLIWPKSDRRILNRRSYERREPDRRQQLSEQLHSEKKYPSTLLSPEERKLIEDLYLDT